MNLRYFGMLAVLSFNFAACGDDDSAVQPSAEIQEPGEGIDQDPVGDPDDETDLESPSPSPEVSESPSPSPSIEPTSFPSPSSEPTPTSKPCKPKKSKKSDIYSLKKDCNVE